MTNTEQLYQQYLSSAGVCTDTRQIAEGTLFFALKGENFDANQFAQQALNAGAFKAVIDNPEFESADTLLVENVLESLQELARHHRQQLKIPVIGLTGSNGKTTSKELMAAVLAKKYNTAFTKGNLNNHIGVPLTLLSITKEHEIAIIEMGANHQKEIQFLCSICQPDYGYITNFGKAHLEGFGGIEGVIKGKSELYDFLRENGRKAFVNADDPKQIAQSKGIEQITFGESSEADYQLKLVDKPGAETVLIGFDGLTAVSQLTGKYNFSNLGAAVAVGKHFGVSDQDIQNALQSYLPQNNRSQINKTERNKLVIDTYNANPSSTEAALLNFTAFPETQKWVILGDMFEMGEYSEEEHQRIAMLALSYDFEKVILVGEEYSRCPLQSKASLIRFKTTDELLKFLEEQKTEGKLVLLKGSRGMKLEQAIPLL